MINYIEVGKLVPANKEIVKHKCWGAFDVFWDEVQRNYAKREDLLSFSKDDWREVYNFALHFDGLDSFITSTPSHTILHTIVNNFLLGYSYHEWVKHFKRMEYLMVAPAMFKPIPQFRIKYDCEY